MNYHINRHLAEQIVDSVKEVCAQDVNFIAPDGIIIASTDKKRIGTFHEIGQQVAATGEMIEVNDDNSYAGTHAGVNMPITYNQTLVAVIGISGEPDKVRKYAHLAERITRILIREQELTAISRQDADKKHYVLDALLHHAEIRPEYLSACLEEWKINPTTGKRVLLLQTVTPENPAAATLSESKIIRLLNRLNIRLYSYYYPNQYVAITDENSFTSGQSLLQQFADTYAGLVRISIGKCTDMERLNRSAETARTALATLQNTQVNYAAYDTLEQEILFSCIDETHRQEYCEKIIGKLSQEDKNLLTAYYEEGMSLQKTCQRLYLHKNTVQYQLNRIARICGKDPRHFRDAVLLYLALQL